jgi:hypothetical protein
MDDFIRDWPDALKEKLSKQYSSIEFAESASIGFSFKERSDEAFFLLCSSDGIEL